MTQVQILPPLLRKVPETGLSWLGDRVARPVSTHRRKAEPRLPR